MKKKATSRVRQKHAGKGVVSAIFPQELPYPGALFFGGGVMWDERLIEGRLVTRYRSPHGQIWPDMHIGDAGKNATMPDFKLGINGKDLSLGWQFKGWEQGDDQSGYRASAGSHHAVMSLHHVEGAIGLRVHTRVDSSRFMIRWLEVVNRGSEAVAITDLAPLAGTLWSHLIHMHVPPDWATPFELFRSHSFDACKEGDFYGLPLAEGVTSVDGGRLGKSGWGRPAFWVINRALGQTVVCELEWSGNYEYQLQQHVETRQDGSRHADLSFRMGLSGHDPALRVLEPGETVRTPAVHLGFFEQDMAAVVQATHDHVRDTVMPEQVRGRHIEVEANHRGYLCDRETVPDIIRDIDLAADAGVELYVIDAGWYGTTERNAWWLNVGDWVAGPWLKGGLEPIVAHARKRGMKFGLWVEIEAAGDWSQLQKDHPDWLFSREGKSINKRCLDFSNSAVVHWAEEQIAGLIARYQLDLYRIDNNHTLTPSGNRVHHGFTEDLIWRYYENFYGMWERLRRRFPSVVFQNCSSGGGRQDWGIMRHFHNVELTDFLRQPRVLRIFNGVSLSLPPEILLRTFGTEAWTPVLDGDLDSQLRAVFLGRPILRGLAPSEALLSDLVRSRVGHYLKIYRELIRPLLPRSRMYHHTPFQPLEGSDAWNIVELASADGRTAVLAVFRTSPVGSAEIVIRPKGLRADASYEVVIDSTNARAVVSGWNLMQEGVRLPLERSMSSEWLLFRSRSKTGSR